MLSKTCLQKSSTNNHITDYLYFRLKKKTPKCSRCGDFTIDVQKIERSGY